MQNPILIKRSTLNKITLGILAAGLAVPLLFASCRAAVLHYFITAVLIWFAAGFIMSLFLGRLITSRLKARLPEWRKQIEEGGFGRFFRSQGPKHEQILISYIRKDPEHEQILAERRLAQIYSALWVYPAAAVIIVLIIVYGV